MFASKTTCHSARSDESARFGVTNRLMVGVSRTGPNLLFRSRVTRVQVEVEFEDADARFTEEAELAGERVLVDKSTNLGLGDVALFCDAGDLELRGRG